MPVWAFIFVLAAAIIFAVDAWILRKLISVGLCLFALAFMFLYTTTGSLVHF